MDINGTNGKVLERKIMSKHNCEDWRIENLHKRLRKEILSICKFVWIRSEWTVFLIILWQIFIRRFGLYRFIFTLNIYRHWCFLYSRNNEISAFKVCFTLFKYLIFRTNYFYNFLNYTSQFIIQCNFHEIAKDQRTFTLQITTYNS